MFFSKIKKGKVLSLSKGFTLVELLVVIAIIGILSGTVAVNTSAARKKANVNKAKADVAKMMATYETWKAVNGNFTERKDFESGGGGWDVGDSTAWNTIWTGFGLTAGPKPPPGIRYFANFNYPTDEGKIIKYQFYACWPAEKCTPGNSPDSVSIYMARDGEIVE